MLPIRVMCVSCFIQKYETKNLQDNYWCQYKLHKEIPYNIAVAKRRDLAYSDNGISYINLGSDKHTIALIKLSERPPLWM